jgi:hypothetical protein
VEGRAGHEAGEAVQVTQLACGWHRDIVTQFPGEKKPRFPENHRVFATLIGNFYPLRDAKSQFLLVKTPYVGLVKIAIQEGTDNFFQASCAPDWSREIHRIYGGPICIPNIAESYKQIWGVPEAFETIQQF